MFFFFFGQALQWSWRDGRWFSGVRQMFTDCAAADSILYILYIILFVLNVNFDKPVRNFTGDGPFFFFPFVSPFYPLINKFLSFFSPITRKLYRYYENRLDFFFVFTRISYGYIHFFFFFYTTTTKTNY